MANHQSQTRTVRSNWSLPNAWVVWPLHIIESVHIRSYYMVHITTTQKKCTGTTIAAWTKDVTCLRARGECSSTCWRTCCRLITGTWGSLCYKVTLAKWGLVRGPESMPCVHKFIHEFMVGRLITCVYKQHISAWSTSLLCNLLITSGIKAP